MSYILPQGPLVSTGRYPQQQFPPAVVVERESARVAGWAGQSRHEKRRGDPRARRRIAKHAGDGPNGPAPAADPAGTLFEPVIPGAAGPRVPVPAAIAAPSSSTPVRRRAPAHRDRPTRAAALAASGTWVPPAIDRSCMPPRRPSLCRTRVPHRHGCATVDSQHTRGGRRDGYTLLPRSSASMPQHSRLREGSRAECNTSCYIRQPSAAEWPPASPPVAAGQSMSATRGTSTLPAPIQRGHALRRLHTFRCPPRQQCRRRGAHNPRRRNRLATKALVRLRDTSIMPAWLRCSLGHEFL